MYQLKEVPLKPGDVFDKWTVVKLDPKTPNKHTNFVCRCVCGATSVIFYKHLLNKVSTGCRDCHKKLGPTTCQKGHDMTLGTTSKGRCKACAIEYALLNLYGITAEEYRALYELQKGRCAICNKPLSVNDALGFGRKTLDTRRAEVDHKHVPKKVKPQPPKRSLIRGLLCGGRYAGCNAKLGHVDNIVWLESAVSYLKDLPAQRLLKESVK